MLELATKFGIFSGESLDHCFHAIKVAARYISLAELVGMEALRASLLTSTTLRDSAITTCLAGVTTVTGLHRVLDVETDSLGSPTQQVQVGDACRDSGGRLADRHMKVLSKVQVTEKRGSGEAGKRIARHQESGKGREKPNIHI
jgi:hypothetical protein